MIPKVIHYCWFGGNPLPPLAKRCIVSWEKFFSDYEIKEWNESNFDVNSIPYTKQAYEAKKYAFVSDYARFWILYNYGGVYFDTDVEVVKDMKDIIASGNFMGKEAGALMQLVNGNKVDFINPGLGLAITPNHALFQEFLDVYATYNFRLSDGSLNTKTIVTTTTEVLLQHGYTPGNGIQKIEDILLYPAEYFCPKNYYTEELELTSNTRSIHHYDASWKSNNDKLKKKLVAILGKKMISVIVKLKSFL